MLLYRIQQHKWCSKQWEYTGHFNRQKQKTYSVKIKKETFHHVCANIHRKKNKNIRHGGMKTTPATDRAFCKPNLTRSTTHEGNARSNPGGGKSQDLDPLATYKPDTSFCKQNFDVI